MEAALLTFVATVAQAVVGLAIVGTGFVVAYLLVRGAMGGRS